eukprot:3128489-Rhodomonas_salina.1
MPTGAHLRRRLYHEVYSSVAESRRVQAMTATTQRKAFIGVRVSKPRPSRSTIWRMIAGKQCPAGRAARCPALKGSVVCWQEWEHKRGRECDAVEMCINEGRDGHARTWETVWWWSFC